MPQDSSLTDYAIMLTRVAAAIGYAQLQMDVARDLFDRGYLSLSEGQRIAVDAALIALLQRNVSELGPEHMMALTQRPPAGFQPSAGAKP